MICWGGSGTVLSVELIIPHYWSKTYLSSLPHCFTNNEFFQSSQWEQALFPALCEHRALFLSLALGSFFTCIRWSIFCQTLGKQNPLQISGILSLCSTLHSDSLASFASPLSGIIVLYHLVTSVFQSCGFPVLFLVFFPLRFP